jgi:uncharacterized protein YndB with AHSA1/START domain
VEKMTKSDLGKETREVRITRIFRAPRELVWKAWTNQRQLAKWWSPDMFTIPVCELDVRPGGKLRIHMRGPDGTIYPMTGVYREIVKPEKLVFTNEVRDIDGNLLFEVLTTATFVEQKINTKLTVCQSVIRVISPEAEQYLAGMEPGMKQSLDHLSEYLQSK